jgi:hypothetical protein
MRLTSLQHRNIAKALRQKAAKLPKDKSEEAKRLQRNASLHLGLARAQDQDPSLTPPSDQ